MAHAHSTPPQVVGRYAIDSPFAAGGMATVHLGRTKGPHGFSRTVAVKRMHPSLASDPELTARFVDEARLASRVRHVNVVPTLDVVAEDGELLIVMEYVSGLSLARVLAEPALAFGAGGSPVPRPIVSALLIDVLEGLHAAHSARTETGQALALVHRDVSPQNVLLGTDGIARVIDFGIATAAERLHLTDDNRVRGKVGYIAPEQFLGEPVTFAADIYGAGVMLWELLAHRRLMGGVSKEHIERVVLGDHDGPRRYQPDVPVALETIVMQALSPSPARRFESAHAMAAAVQSACPRAASLEVSAWLQHAAAAPLEAQAAELARFESAPEHTLSRVQPSAAGAVAYDPTITLTDLAPTEHDPGLASAPVPSAAPSPARPRTSRRALGTIAVSTVVVMGAIALAVATQGPRTLAAPATPAAGSTPLATSEVPAIVAEAPHDVAPLTTAVRAPASRHNVRTTAPARSASTPRCKVPFFFDADGVKHYRPECMP